MSYCSSATLLFFEENQSALSSAELKILKTWLNDSRLQPTAKILVVGGAFETPHAGRLRRLQGILSALEEMGISLRRIQAVEDGSTQTKLDLMGSLPTDVAWIGY